MKLQKASESRRATESWITTLIHNEMNEVSEAIKQAIESGHYEVTLERHLRSEVSAKLVLLEYNVIQETHEPRTTISW